MKGIIFNAVEFAITDLFSEDTWDDLLDAANLSGDYTAIGTYDDADLGALVAAGCTATGMDAATLTRTIGTHAFPHLAQRHPEFVENIDGLRSFMHSVDHIIHPEVMKLHPDAKPPRFQFEDLENGSLRLTYSSTRRLGVLAEGLIQGAANWFCEDVEITLVEGAGAEDTTYDLRITPRIG